jgi:hypothetical protein
VPADRLEQRFTRLHHRQFRRISDGRLQPRAVLRRQQRLPQVALEARRIESGLGRRRAQPPPQALGIAQQQLLAEPFELRLEIGNRGHLRAEETFEGRHDNESPRRRPIRL